LQELGTILDLGLRVMIFAGQYDIICNHLGVEKAMMRIDWKHQMEWQKTSTGTWMGRDGKVPAGYVWL